MLLQWSPWNELSRLEHAMNHLRDTRTAAPRGEKPVQPAWQPSVDVYDHGDRIVLVADLPGVDDKDIDISLDKNVLTLKGERKSAGQGDGYQRLERLQGAFARSFTLPPTVDAEKVTAELKAGVLTLTLLKKSESQPHKIRIQAA